MKKCFFREIEVNLRSLDYAVHQIKVGLILTLAHKNVMELKEGRMMSRFESSNMIFI